jgi:hypothetical protein
MEVVVALNNRVRGTSWGWIAGIVVVVVLIGIALWNSNREKASVATTAPPATSGTNTPALPQGGNSNQNTAR